MLCSVLNQYGTHIVLFIPNCPIKVCNTNVNSKYNNNEQNKTNETEKKEKRKTALVQDFWQTPESGTRWTEHLLSTALYFLKGGNPSAGGRYLLKSRSYNQFFDLVINMPVAMRGFSFLLDLLVI